MEKNSSPKKHAIAGTLAACLSVSITQPIDLVKTRLQLQEMTVKKAKMQRNHSNNVNIGNIGNIAANERPLYTGTWDCLVRIVKEEGGFFKGLYKGLSANMFGSAVSWGLYFLIYNHMKDFLVLYNSKEKNYTNHSHLSRSEYFFSGAVAGISVVLLTNPIWVIKTRMQADYTRTSNSYNNVFDGIKRLTLEEGFRGLYKGIVPAILAVPHGAIQFAVYEDLNKTARKYLSSFDNINNNNNNNNNSNNNSNNNHPLLNLIYSVNAMLSKIVAATVTYPTQVVRARLQESRPLPGVEEKYRGPADVCKKIIKNEGFRGFYNAFVPNLIRVLPSSVITFVSYEWFMRIMNDF